MKIAERAPLDRTTEVADTFVMLNENSITDFKANLRGRLIEPGDKDYDEARKVYNGMIHKKPRLIARCADVADVINSVNFARENDCSLQSAAVDTTREAWEFATTAWSSISPR